MSDVDLCFERHSQHNLNDQKDKNIKTEIDIFICIKFNQINVHDDPKMKTNFCIIISTLICVSTLLGSHGALVPLGNVAITKQSPERVLTIATRTADCFQCGMIEGLGFLDVKV